MAPSCGGDARTSAYNAPVVLLPVFKAIDERRLWWLEMATTEEQGSASVLAELVVQAHSSACGGSKYCSFDGEAQRASTAAVTERLRV